MSSPTLSPNAQLARTTLLANPEYYGLVNLALASFAYTDSYAPNQYQQPETILVVPDLQKSIEALPPLPIPPSPGTVAGVWSLVWGPAYSPDYSNLIYAATYSDGGTQAEPGAPIFVAVCIRGTDTNVSDGDAMLNQIYQDMQATTTVVWPSGGLDPLDFTSPRIATGTWAGLQKLLNLSPSTPAPGTPAANKTNTIVQFIQSMLAQDSSLPIVVTGHSLGGCQSTVMAPWLQKNLPVSASQIVLTPFAPPTAGDARFVSEVLNQFSSSIYWANFLDLIPKAFSDVNAMKGLWQDYSWPPPPTVPVTPSPTMTSTDKGIVDMIVAIGGLTHNYTQPTLMALQGESSLLPSQQTMTDFLTALGSQDTWSSWVAQLMWQHFPPCYWLAICAEFSSTQVAPFYGPTNPPVIQNPLIKPILTNGA